jgi:hypothetical protein
MTTPTAKTLYQTVEKLGLTRAQVRRILPRWWAPEVETSADGVAELAMHLSRRLSLDLAALLVGEVKPKGAVTKLAFKHQSNIDPTSLSAASFIASSLAQAVLAASTAPCKSLSRNPDELQALVRQSGSIVGFDALLALCWEHGIPVIPLPNLPVGVRKMDGAALRVGERPVIVIARRKSSRAWLSFILAHEIAHIALGHIDAGSTIIDVSLQEAATYAAESSGDAQEREADAFALQLMGGTGVAHEVARWDASASAVELAVAGRTGGTRLGVEPGHLILRHAFASKRWPEAVAALRFLSEDMDAERAILGQLRSNVDMDLVADDLQDLVSQVTGWNDFAD